MDRVITHYMIGYCVNTAMVESFIVEGPMLAKKQLVDFILGQNPAFISAKIIAVSPMTLEEYNAYMNENDLKPLVAR